MNVLDLFSGIGGFSLGLERAGMRTVAFCEIDAYARAVLAKHWPDVPCYEDIRTLTAERLAADGIAADLICGGFPCQDISNAGKRAGIDGEQSGLWSEYARIIGEVRPRYVIVENVAALLGRGLERVLGDLAALGFDAEWHCIPASAVGAPHRRDRLWIVAHAARTGCEAWCADRVRNDTSAHDASATAHGCSCAHVAYAERDGREGIGDRIDFGSATFYDARGAVTRTSDARNVPDADRPGTASSRDDCGMGWEGEQISKRAWRDDAGWWRIEPDVGRVAHGVPSRVDRLRCLGNAIVPQIAEIIGRAINDSAQ